MKLIVCIFLEIMKMKLNYYDYNEKYYNEELKKKYLEAKEINKKLFEENIELYVTDEKIKFDFKYKINDSKEIKVKFNLKIIKYKFYVL